MDGERRQRLIVAGVAGVVVLAGLLVGNITGGDGAADRLLASGPTTTVGGPARTTVAGGSGLTATTAGQGASANPSPSGTTATAGGDPTTGAAPSSTAGGSGGGGGPSAGGGAASGPAGGSTVGGRTSGVGGGGITGGIPESVESDPAGGSSSGRSGPGSGSSSGSGVGATTTTAAPSPGPGPGAQTHTLSQADNGRAITVRVGDLVLLRLDPVGGGVWSDPASDGPALRREAVSVLDGAVTGSFTAASAGTAALTSIASQTCSTANPPCLAPAIQLRITVTVTA